MRKRVELKDEYRLWNRDDLEVYLTRVEEDDLYELKCESQYMRIIYNNDGTINAVDPPGGPYISVGSEVDKGVYVQEFLSTYILRLTTNEKNVVYGKA
jgi:hypothetical protein